ncbi:MAG: L,D-transpeptidase family protein [Maritimibacter sp.]
MIQTLPRLGLKFASTLLLSAVLLTTTPPPVSAQSKITAFAQAIAEAATGDEDIAAFYRDNGYEPIWTGTSETHAARREALFRAIQHAPDHGLPAADYNTAALEAQLRAIASPRDVGQAEVALSALFLRYAKQIQTGILTPSKVDNGIKREVPLRDRTELLQTFTTSTPAPFLRNLPPKSEEYARLMREKLRLERDLASGGWGAKVPANSLKPGQSGEAVIALRNRLISMGYMDRIATATYDANLQKAVQDFQEAHGLNADGVAGAGTISAINAGISDRIESILVAMERERWMNIERGDRYIWVNLTTFSARIVDGGKVTFETRSVIGKNTGDRRTPEFSDVMEHMVINPTWHVPRSIVTKEYLPAMQRNPGAAGHLKLIDSRGRVVSRSSVNFSAYNARNFPYAMKQPPSSRNALGLVKFIFPNKYNIYLHDTPAKSLFAREVRAYSHGCIRLQQPFEFAYALLGPEVDDPKGTFHSYLRTGQESVVKLKKQVPVHLVYRTAFTDTQGRMNYRADIYDRDARIWSALEAAGVRFTAGES